MNVMKRCCLAFFVLVSMATGSARAGLMLDTVAFTADTLADGMGSGTLSGGTIVVTYNTAAVGNGGVTLPMENFTTSLATAPAVSSVTSNTGGIFATSVGTLNPQSTITFSATVVDPILLVNFADATSTLNFGSTVISLLSSNNTQQTGSVLKFLGSNNTSNDGFAAKITGTFGPGTPISFTYTTTNSVQPDSFDSIGFTVGLPATPPLPTPEPSTVFMAGTAAFFGLIAYRRRKRAA